MNLKFKKGFLMQKIAGENVLLPAGADTVDMSKMLVLNESATLILSNLMKASSITIEELTNDLIQMYEVEYEQAENDVKELVYVLRELNMFEKA